MWWARRHAKKAMSVAVYNHYKRVATDTMDDIEIEKSNMLMIGPYRIRQDLSCKDAGKTSGCAACHHGRHLPDGGGLHRR